MSYRKKLNTLAAPALHQQQLSISKAKLCVVHSYTARGDAEIACAAAPVIFSAPLCAAPSSCYYEVSYI